MTSEIPIPQELIDKVIDQLHADTNTLKTCAVVSHSFLHSSRKHLFFSIDIGPSMSSQRLYRVLKLQPDIAPLIREFYIFVGDFQGGACEWITKDTLLPGILEMTHNLQLISLYGSVFPSDFIWDSFSIGVQSALLDRLQSPGLTEVRLDGIGKLPTYIIPLLTHVRKLRLKYVGFHDDSTTHISANLSGPLDKLEALELYYCSTPLPLTVSPLIQKLRLLSILSPDWETLFSAQSVISSSASSIKSVVWYYSWADKRRTMEVNQVIQLCMFHNLDFLFFGMRLSQGVDEPQFAIDLSSLAQHFKDSVSKALQEITICIGVQNYADWNDALLPLSSCQGWATLDEALWNRSPALGKVHIWIDVNDADHPVTCKPLDFLMRLHLPRLAERGILSTGFGTFQEVRNDAWLRA